MINVSFSQEFYISCVCPYFTQQNKSQDIQDNDACGFKTLLLLFVLDILNICRQVIKRMLSDGAILRPYYCLLHPDVVYFKHP